GIETVSGSIEFNSKLFTKEAIEQFSDHLINVLRQALEEIETPLVKLDLLTEADQRKLLAEWNNGRADYRSESCVHHIFESQVERTPHAAAVVYNGERLSYGELNAQANRLAHHLRTLGVAPDARVAICMERSLDMVVGLLAILKAGGAYVPLDPAYPAERLRYMLADSAPVAILTHSQIDPDIRATLVAAGAPMINAQESVCWASAPATNPDPASVGLKPEHLAYVIYTSGSTGKPKGVMVEHGNVARLFSATQEWFNFDQNDVWTLFHSFAFDFSVWEIWGALLYGGRLVVVPQLTSRSPQEFYRLLCREGVTILNQTPSAFRQLIVAQGESGEQHRLRHIIFGGEALEVATLKPWYENRQNQHTQIINMYGITETTVHVTYRPLEPADALIVGNSPIGARIPDLKVYLLGSANQPVPMMLAGEMHVGGAGVARGYLNRPELTAERFLPDPFTGEPGARIYKTGDLGRYLPDGGIEFLGRNDSQVKIRGFRIELGEIEARLAEHPAVQDARVIVKESGDQGKQLIAYIVPSRQRAFAVSQLLRMEKAGLGTAAQRVELPNGLTVFHQNQSETDFVYEEVFADEVYLKHGVTLRDGDCIFDVGANVGLFTLFAGQRCPNAAIYAFEPVPPVYSSLQLNAELYGLNVKLFNCGLGDKPKEAVFTFYPHNTLISSNVTSPEQAHEGMKSFLLNKHRAAPGDAPVNEALLDKMVQTQHEAEQFTGHLRTLSGVIGEEGIERIDLLKVDVENAEYEVLQGIKESDFQKINQLVLAVHDVDGRLAKIAELLKAHGYEVNFDQDKSLQNTALYNLYAVRASNGRGAKDASRAAAQADVEKVWTSQAPLLRDLQSFLRERFPDYMVPANLVLLDQMPLTPNGKLDLQALPAPDRAHFGSEEEIVEPRTEVERLLSSIWCDVLGLEKVGINENFFKIGGDSIIAIQIIARANKAGLNLRAEQIFRHQTIGEMAEAAGKAPIIESTQGIVSGAVPLTPIQQWFFEQNLPDRHHYNQAVLLEVSPTIDAHMLGTVVGHLMMHHDALRLRFAPLEPGWSQFNAASDESKPFTYFDLSGLPEARRAPAMEAAVEEMQSSINLSEGPLLRAALFGLGEHTAARLFIAINHLAVDGVSWRILIEDLEAACLQVSRGEAISLPPKTTPYKEWAESLVAYARTDKLNRERDYWRAASRLQAHRLPVDFPEGANSFASARKLTVSLSIEETEALLREVPKAYRTQIGDVLLTALAQAFCRWTGENLLLVDMEGHGREEIIENLDLSRTVGWFTTIYPTLLRYEVSSDPGEALKSIKEQIRSIPNRGIGYGLLRYISDDVQLRQELRAMP
ncbi:MAG TPA: amino acid adenylation domain-containing protein, partial [Blastocatellia bacterium]